MRIKKSQNLISNAFAAVLIGGLLLAGSCKKEDPPCCDSTNPTCPNYDECIAMTPVNAGFIFSDPIGDGVGNTLFFDSDTLVGGFGLRVHFIADYKSEDNGTATYTWLIGNETIHGEHVVRWGFPVDTPITVTLIVNATPNINCFPLDDGIDTITRQFVVIDTFIVDMQCQTRLRGKYRGFNIDEPERIFDIDIDPCTLLLNWNDYVINGLLDGCGSIIIEGKSYSYIGTGFQYAYATSPACTLYTFNGYMYLPEPTKDTLRLKYTYNLEFEIPNLISKEFVGVRLE